MNFISQRKPQIPPLAGGRFRRRGGLNACAGLRKLAVEVAFRNEAEDLIIQSRDGLLEVRFDVSNPAPHAGPHVHVIEYQPFKNGKVEIFNQPIPITPKG